MRIAQLYWLAIAMILPLLPLLQNDTTTCKALASKSSNETNEQEKQELELAYYLADSALCSAHILVEKAKIYLSKGVLRAILLIIWLMNAQSIAFTTLPNNNLQVFCSNNILLERKRFSVKRMLILWLNLLSSAVLLRPEQPQVVHNILPTSISK